MSDEQTEKSEEATTTGGATMELEQMPPLDEIIVPVGAQDGLDDPEHELRRDDLLTGEVVLITHDGVLVDIGTKSEGLIRPNELSKDPVTNLSDVVQIGDKINVVVLDPEGKDGVVILSKKRADYEQAWVRVKEAQKTGEIVNAVVIEKVKGGLVVDLGIRGFVPASHVSNGKLKNFDKFIGQTIPLKVLEVERDRRQGKVVLSHREAIEADRQKQRDETLSNLKEGEIRTGIVRRVTDYGAFVDLGGIDGLLHVSEMSWTRVKSPDAVVKRDQEVQVVILKISPDQDRISLGMRQILPDPWLTVTDSHHIGDAVSGEVTRLVPFGAFVQLASGIEGIIPLSEISHRRVAKPNDVLEVGDTVQVRIQDIRPEERRMSLSLKALQSPDAEVEYRSAPRGGVSGTDTAGTDGGRKKKDKKRREGSSEGGGDFRAYMRSGNEFGATLGDMFGDMFASSSRSAGGGRRERRRHMEDEDEDLSDITGDDVIEAEALEAESVVEAPTEE